jgi:hypothetical protein
MKSLFIAAALLITLSAHAQQATVSNSLDGSEKCFGLPEAQMGACLDDWAKQRFAPVPSIAQPAPEIQAQRYQTAFVAWSNCTLASLDKWRRAMEVLSISYPRFGIAWSAQKADLENATSAANGLDQAAATEAHRRFEDRILRTAESEALEYYNLARLQLDRQFKQCGPMPESPRRQL